MKKCKYIKKCKLYSEQSESCNEIGGTYNLLEDKYAGCYKLMELQEKRSKENA